LASLALCGLSSLEHGRNVALSALTTTYLAADIFTNIIKLELLLVAENMCDIGFSATGAFGVKLVALLLECQTKEHILREPYDRLSGEETAGLSSRQTPATLQTSEHGHVRTTVILF
jgi:hypothetical protein